MTIFCIWLLLTTKSSPLRFLRNGREQLLSCGNGCRSLYQRQGIGKNLIHALFDKYPKTKKIFLVTETANAWAQTFYERIGFKASAFIHPDYPENFTGYEYDIESQVNS